MIVEDRLWGVWLSVQDRELHAVTSSPSLVYLNLFLGACLWTCLHALHVYCVYMWGEGLYLRACMHKEQAGSGLVFPVQLGSLSLSPSPQGHSGLFCFLSGTVRACPQEFSRSLSAFLMPPGVLEVGGGRDHHCTKASQFCPCHHGERLLHLGEMVTVSSKHTH